MKPARALDWSEAAGAEAELIERCGRGDEDACREVLEEHQRMVFNLALQVLADEQEALDLSQEVFLRVFRTIHRFRGGSSLRTWIYRIVINQARNRQRWWRRRRQAYHVSLDSQVSDHRELPAPPAWAAPDRVLDQKELGRRLWHALARLPFEQRSAIVLRELHGMRYTEIAFSLGVTVGAVKSRLARARETLRAELKAS